MYRYVAVRYIYLNGRDVQYVTTNSKDNITYYEDVVKKYPRFYKILKVKRIL